MSADNYLVIFHDDDGIYRAFQGCASNDETYEELRTGYCVFEAHSKDEAICKAQLDYYEYGYHFL